MKKSFTVYQVYFVCFICPLVIFAYSETNVKKYRYISPRNISSFITELNQLGSQGYRLKNADRNRQTSYPENPNLLEIAGIVEYKEGDTFEYEYFHSLTLKDFIAQFDPKAELGFYFSGRIGYSLWKDPSLDLPEITAKEGTTERDQEVLKRTIEYIRRMMSTEPIDGSYFVLERKNKIGKPIHFRLITATPSTSIWRTSVINIRKVSETLIDSIENEVDTKTFQPVAMFYSSAVFKTRVSHLPTILFQNNSEDFNEKPLVYKVFRGSKKDNEEFRKQGFTIKGVVDGFVLVVQDNRGVSYLGVSSESKDFIQKLDEFAKSGAKYFTKINNNFFFEISPQNKKQFEYKILNLNRVPSLRGNINSIFSNFDDFVNQGFEPRTLFDENGMNVLFEKQKD